MTVKFLFFIILTTLFSWGFDSFFRHSVAFLLQKRTVHSQLKQSSKKTCLLPAFNCAKIWFAFIRVFLVKIHDNVMTHLIFDALHLRQDELGWLHASFTLNLYILASLCKNFKSLAQYLLWFWLVESWDDNC